MASNYTPQDAINLIKNFVHGIPLTDSASNLCDMVNSMMWHYFPWGWSIKSLTAINLVDGTQDYTATDTDILRPLKMRIVRTDSSPNEYRELAMLGDLGVELSRKGGLDTVKAVGYFSSTNFFRFDVAIGIGGTQTMQLQGEYQKLPTAITNGSMNTVFQFPDRYFNVFVEGLKWKIYQLADDPRAGGIAISKNGNMMKQYQGQYGIFMEQLMTMARTEDLGSGDQFRFPADSLGIGRSYWPGLYGL